MNKYEAYEAYEEYRYVDHSRSAHRRRRGKDPSAQARRYRRRKVERMVEMSDGGEDFVPTYVANLDPRHHEREWVISSLRGFYVNNQVADVLRLVKGGKEANVYLCQANPTLDVTFLAAKLYRPRMLRHLKNNAMYKEGRFMRDSDGKLVHGEREQRAMDNKTRFGQALDLSNWIMHEFGIQQRLYAAGGDVPRPVARGGNTILMEYLGDAVLPAPMLQEVRLAPEEVRPLFNRLMQNVRLMLQHHLVHGDLSAYNVLYWQGRVTIIDFPQVVDARKNGNAFALLERDVQRVCDYFAAYDLAADGTNLAADLWHRYMHAEL
jgi:RIO kinase 1